jgi:hypothetical protein
MQAAPRTFCSNLSISAAVAPSSACRAARAGVRSDLLAPIRLHRRPNGSAEPATQNSSALARQVRLPPGTRSDADLHTNWSTWVSQISRTTNPQLAAASGAGNGARRGRAQVLPDSDYTRETARFLHSARTRKSAFDQYWISLSRHTPPTPHPPHSSYAIPPHARQEPALLAHPQSICSGRGGGEGGCSQRPPPPFRPPPWQQLHCPRPPSPLSRRLPCPQLPSPLSRPPRCRQPPSPPDPC